jgi:hypothetical protein
MREEHPNQMELSGLDNDVKEMSELAILQAEVLEKGLVKETRPVFVFDKTLAVEKKGNALRQEKHRQSKQAQGLKTGFAPAEVLEKVKELGGGAEGWSQYLNQLRSVQIETREVPKEIIVTREVPVEVIKTVEIEVVKEASLSNEDNQALAVGRRIQMLKGFKAMIARLIIE